LKKHKAGIKQIKGNIMGGVKGNLNATKNPKEKATESLMIRLVHGTKKQFKKIAESYQPKKVSVTQMLRLRGSIKVNSHLKKPKNPTGALIITSYDDNNEAGGMGCMVLRLTECVGHGDDCEWERPPVKGEYWIAEHDILKLLTENYK
jgi:hypothetical protein